MQSTDPRCMAEQTVVESTESRAFPDLRRSLCWPSRSHDVRTQLIARPRVVEVAQNAAHHESFSDPSKIVLSTQ